MLQVKASEAAEPDEQEDIRVRKEIRLYRCSDQESHHTGIGLKLGPRLRELFPRGQRASRNLGYSFYPIPVHK